MQCLARLEEIRAFVCDVLNTCRLALIPYVVYGGRNMSLLSGVWVDSVDISPTIKAVYDASRHQVIPLTRESYVLGRWKWVMANSTINMSDFFGTLKVARGIELTDKEAISLFIHQTGKIPFGPITVMFRDGTEGTVEGV